MNNLSESLEQLTTAQLAGLGALVYLAIREETTVLYQFEEWGFDDVPQEIVAYCDFSEVPLEHIAFEIAVYVLQDLTISQEAKKQFPLYNG